jgi:hypothetical protein
MEQPSSNHQTDSPGTDRQSRIQGPRSSILDPRSSSAARKRRNRGWIWFFVILAVLTITATAILWLYNLNQQLKPEQLAAARKLWQEKGPRDYTLTLTKEGSAQGTYLVSVRHGVVASVLEQRVVKEGGKVKTAGIPLEARLFSYYDMDALFDDLQRFLEIKADPRKGRVFLRAHFDPDDGHIQEYVFSNSTDRQRVRVVVELHRAPPGKPLPKLAPTK